MIALDTNVHVRYLVDDDPWQVQAARAGPEELAPERPSSGALRGSFPAGRLCRSAD